MVEGKAGLANRPGRGGGSPRFAWPVPGPRDRLLRSLEAVATELAGSPSVDRAAALVAEAVASTVEAREIVIAVVDESGRRLHPVHVKGVGVAALSATLAQAWSRGRVEGPVPLDVLPIPPRRGLVLVGRGRGLDREEQAYLRVLAALLGLALAPPRRRRRRAGPHLHVGDLDIDLGEQRVVVGDRAARLTPSEIRLLLFLAEEPGRARTRREILRHLWHSDHVGDERACDAHVSNLRRKIERDPSRPERVVTVRSVGYALLPGSGM
jgi:hypothetical protein